MFEFIRQKNNSGMAFDPTYPVIDMNDFKECKWNYFYRYLKEDIPPNSPGENNSTYTP